MAHVKTKGQKSKEKIMVTALDLIFQKGYNETSTQEIADQCGISQTTVFYHFKNKKKLFTEILKFVIQHNRYIFETMDVDQSEPIDKLKALLLSNIKWTLEFPEQTSIILLLFNFAAHDDEFKTISEEIILNGQQTVLDILNLRLESCENSNKVLARTIQQYANGVMFQILASSAPGQMAHEFEHGLHRTLDFFITESP